MAIKDRGNIKWSSLMLTEHRKKLQEILAEENDLAKPELDEQFLEEMDYLLKLALNSCLEVEITYFKDKRLKNYTGQIKKYYPHKRSIELADRQERSITLLLNNILEVRLVEL